MKIFRVIPLLILFLFSTPIFAQPGNPAQADSSSLQKQFDEMIRVSNRYQSFKVVRHGFLNAFMTNVSDSIRIYTAEIEDLKSTIAEQKATIESQGAEIATRDGEITSLTGEKDSINFLGMPLTKSMYNVILWSLIGLLVFLLLFALARMRIALTTSKEARLAREKTAEELEKSRKSRLEVEQTLRRQLQDERNKREGGK